jgi:Mitochondrial ABC-transporter N-terminal five TM region
MFCCYNSLNIFLSLFVSFLELSIMISYCDNQSNLSVPWISDGISHCFLTTLTSSVLAGIALILGSIEIYVYKRYANCLEFSQWQSVHLKRLYILQLALIFLVATEPVVRLILNATVIGDKHIYGYVPRILVS